jgi:hypothetical protein
MPRRILFFLAIVVGAAQSSFAQTPQSIPASIDGPRQSGNNVRIILEMRWLAGADNIEERIGIGSGAAQCKLPGLGSFAVTDKQQAESLLTLFTGDKRSNVSPTQRITVLDGQKREFSPPDSVQDGDAILATVSDDRQTIEIQLTWPKRQNGMASLPATTATVPVGSHLLIHSEDGYSEPEVHTLNRPQHFLDRLFPRKCIGIGREKQQVFLLVTPRIAGTGEQQQRPAAK